MADPSQTKDFATQCPRNSLILFVPRLRAVTRLALRRWLWPMLTAINHVKSRSRKEGGHTLSGKRSDNWCYRKRYVTRSGPRHIYDLPFPVTLT
jgi:hypothetical protein